MEEHIINLTPECVEYSLIFLGGISGWEQSRGYRSHVYLKKDSMQNWPLYFYDPVRLSQDLEGCSYITEHGLIIVNDVTIDRIVSTVKSLIEDDYFSYQKCFTTSEIAKLYCL